ncbi:hypothetical protein SAMN05880574_11750 [Chryseobacterium sp. RU37D]|uniref:prevent-host-death protein n=1 Tax=Chryseobacterium sp. RU37D TaxID=1907397 RepID=UPI000955C26E|nr:prevent-host-death protein [Chryseobacterium sp. RU37D]SIQ58972.1 hypothetical protein SAMN05880574_11750 [Chryseobacterium sp. RU37D]
MNYKLELNTQEPNSKIVFHTILFDSFKVNLIERYIGSNPRNAKLYEVLFKVRTLDDVLVPRKDGNIRIRIKGEDFDIYQGLIKQLNSYEYKNKLINRKEVEQNYVHFILSLVIPNYQLN